jgi:hypothetical protein
VGVAIKPAGRRQWGGATTLPVSARDSLVRELRSPTLPQQEKEGVGTRWEVALDGSDAVQRDALEQESEEKGSCARPKAREILGLASAVPSLPIDPAESAVSSRDFSKEC